MLLSPHTLQPALPRTGPIWTATMALWMEVLLLLLHCGAGLSYPAPTNVSITSLNMEHTLQFLPGSITPTHTRFRVQVKKVRRKSLWKPAARCSSLRAGQSCNLTALMRDPWDRYQARVQAFSPPGTASDWTASDWTTSDWTTSDLFQPMTNSVVGPPVVFLSGCGNCLVLQVRPQTSRWQQLDRYRHMGFSVRRTRDGAQFHMSVDYKEETVIGYLEPGVEYCVTVSMVAFINQKSAPAKFCAFTSPPRNNSSARLILALLAVFSLLSVVLIGFLVHGSRRSCSPLQAGPPSARTKDPQGVRL